MARTSVHRSFENILNIKFLYQIFNKYILIKIIGIKIYIYFDLYKNLFFIKEFDSV